MRAYAIISAAGDGSDIHISEEEISKSAAEDGSDGYTSEEEISRNIAEDEIKDYSVIELDCVRQKPVIKGGGVLILWEKS